jgi:NADH-quinone oxidoreductase subunit J
VTAVLGAVLAPLLGATVVDATTFAVAATIVIVGAVGVVVSRNPVHAALMLVMTLFGVAVLFVAQQANFLAAVQVIVYAGAIVVLFLFVIMFLGVDRSEDVDVEPIRGQRPLAALLVLLGMTGLLLMGVAAHWAVGAHSVAGPARGQPGGDVAALGRSVFTTYLFPFEITAALLVIAVVGAVVLARRPPVADPEPPDDEDAAEVESQDEVTR